MNQALLDSLICPICLDYAKSPMSTSCCSQVYCEQCILQLEKCATCRAFCVFEKSTLAKNLINHIETKCECGYKCTLGDLDEHKKKCNHSLVKCPLDKCSEQIKKLDLFDHISKLHSDQILNKFDSILKVFKSENDTTAKSKPSINMNNFSIDVQVNKFHGMARLGSNGKYYCGKRLDGPKCSCCDGYCGLHSGCNCSGCMELDLKFRCLPSGWLVNRDGHAAKQSELNLFYCGRKVLDGVPNCDSYCGPNNGPQCVACKNLNLMTKRGGRYSTLLN